MAPRESVPAIESEDFGGCKPPPLTDSKDSKKLSGRTLSVLSGQCLDRRIPNKETLIGEVDAWEASRNKNHAKANWQFTTADARVKLKRLYPTLDLL